MQTRKRRVRMSLARAEIAYYEHLLTTAGTNELLMHLPFTQITECLSTYFRYPTLSAGAALPRLSPEAS